MVVFSQLEFRIDVECVLREGFQFQVVNENLVFRRRILKADFHLRRPRSGIKDIAADPELIGEDHLVIGEQNMRVAVSIVA